MSELRRDPIVHRWVIMAPERATRPIEVTDLPHLVNSVDDPFAEGRESTTTAELLAFRPAESPANGPGWDLRVLPNKYPALSRSASLVDTSDSLYQSLSGVGAHEVIVECPQNEGNISRLGRDKIQKILVAYRDRIVDLKRDHRLAHATIFKNCGAQAGASIYHAHSQLLATPYIPSLIEEELAGAYAYQVTNGRNIFDDIIARELSDGRRIVVDSPLFLAFCPYASRFTYETWIVPRQPESHYEQITAEAIVELAAVLKSVLRRLEVTLNDPPYNYVLHTAPLQQAFLPHYRWHIEIYPRLTRVAGYEWGSGCYINEVLPEQAAQRLREISE